jgi:hypothetical protein
LVQDPSGDFPTKGMECFAAFRQGDHAHVSRRTVLRVVQSFDEEAIVVVVGSAISRETGGTDSGSAA